MSKAIAVIGDEDFVLGFQLAGIRRAEKAETPEEFTAAVDKVLTGPKDVGILIVNAKDVPGLAPNVRRRLSESIDPVVIQMGGEAGGDLREKVKRAIGIDLYKE
ncbi:MAG TPA: V-type ATP synthase subunit F [Candidatus Thermoplasmatota archaeon]|nr:V-type ATP synthase subunit F [Candidatus Thermoplasmatota archaeon]